MFYSPPPLVVHGEAWSRARVTRRASAWRRVLQRDLDGAEGPLALVMTNHPESVALFFALAGFPMPLVLLPPDLAPWRSAPPLPRTTHLVLSPTLRHLEADAGPLDLVTTVLSDPGASGDAPEDPLAIATPGFILFTSGSTGLPRPVYRSAAGLFRVSQALVDAVGARRDGGGVIATLPLARAFGLNHGLVAATVLGVPLALHERFDHNAVLRAFASGNYQYWAGTPVMADVLGRCALTGRHPAPRCCVMGGRVSPTVARRFEERFGVRLRGIYGTTETGTIAIDAGPDAEVRSDTAGRPLPDVGLRIGDDPRQPLAAGTPGRIWLSSPSYMMTGYGFPPDLEPPETIDGWWATPDVGHLDAAGRLTVAGRLDDCFRNAAGHLVNPGVLAAALEAYPGITDVAGFPLATGAGPVLGVLVESTGGVSVDDLRRHLARSLPPWSQPRVVEMVAALPRLSNGRADRRACIERLEASLAAAPR
jgi:acyl-CoA synthetase (AMP-forming)/AMP-acid ligase II